MQPMARQAPVPQPITATFTVKEAAAVHILLTAFLTKAPESLPNPDEITRVAAEIERRLKKAGCVLDDEGWRA